MKIRIGLFCILLGSFLSCLCADNLTTGILFEYLETGEGKFFKNGYLLWKQGKILEIGEDQGCALEEMIRDYSSWKLVEFHRDLAGRERVLIARRVTGRK